LNQFLKRPRYHIINLIVQPIKQEQPTQFLTMPAVVSLYLKENSTTPEKA